MELEGQRREKSEAVARFQRASYVLKNGKS